MLRRLGPAEHVTEPRACPGVGNFASREQAGKREEKERCRPVRPPVVRPPPRVLTRGVAYPPFEAYSGS